MMLCFHHFIEREHVDIIQLLLIFVQSSEKTELA